MPRRAQTSRLFEFAESHTRFAGDETGAEGGAAATESIRLDERHLDAGRGKSVRRRAAGDAAADNRDIDIEMPALPRIRRNA